VFETGAQVKIEANMKDKFDPVNTSIYFLFPELKQSGNPKISKPAMESAIGQVK
jgi:hypothetical protein